MAEPSKTAFGVLYDLLIRSFRVQTAMEGLEAVATACMNANPTEIIQKCDELLQTGSQPRNEYLVACLIGLYAAIQEAVTPDSPMITRYISILSSLSNNALPEHDKQKIKSWFRFEDLKYDYLEIALSLIPSPPETTPAVAAAPQDPIEHLRLALIAADQAEVLQSPVVINFFTNTLHDRDGLLRAVEPEPSLYYIFSELASSAGRRGFQDFLNLVSQAMVSFSRLPSAWVANLLETILINSFDIRSILDVMTQHIGSVQGHCVLQFFNMLLCSHGAKLVEVVPASDVLTSTLDAVTSRLGAPDVADQDIRSSSLLISMMKHNFRNHWAECLKTRSAALLKVILACPVASKKYSKQIVADIVKSSEKIDICDALPYLQSVAGSHPSQPSRVPAKFMDLVDQLYPISFSKDAEGLLTNLIQSEAPLKFRVAALHCILSSPTITSHVAPMVSNSLNLLDCVPAKIGKRATASVHRYLAALSPPAQKTMQQNLWAHRYDLTLGRLCILVLACCYIKETRADLAVFCREFATARMNGRAPWSSYEFSKVIVDCVALFPSTKSLNALLLPCLDACLHDVSTIAPTAALDKFVRIFKLMLANCHQFSSDQARGLLPLLQRCWQNSRAQPVVFVVASSLSLGHPDDAIKTGYRELLQSSVQAITAQLADKKSRADSPQEVASTLCMVQCLHLASLPGDEIKPQSWFDLDLLIVLADETASSRVRFECLSTAAQMTQIGNKTVVASVLERLFDRVFEKKEVSSIAPVIRLLCSAGIDVWTKVSRTIRSYDMDLVVSDPEMLSSLLQACGGKVTDPAPFCSCLDDLIDFVAKAHANVEVSREVMRLLVRVVEHLDSVPALRAHLLARLPVLLKHLHDLALDSTKIGGKRHLLSFIPPLLARVLVYFPLQDSDFEAIIVSFLSLFKTDEFAMEEIKDCIQEIKDATQANVSDKAKILRVFSLLTQHLSQ
eukprot:TRINITY_DN15274_c0_g1_i1.p1 TRINITY_DN15274_c0_g1~~TRINITY_DN15274_c0_g1_i1.p1  ORF type:complete len:959 (-),score=161.13 TRINITY_DN15274_c0_g1_i1:89-2965(-)